MRRTPTTIFMLTGTAGTGKDYLAAEFAKRHPGVAIAPSFTREGYKEYTEGKYTSGVANEAHALKMGAEELFRFQNWLMQFCIRRMREWIRAQRINPEVKVAILTRTPYDHAAYLLSACEPYLVNRIMLERTANAFLSSHKDVKILHLPHPAPWYGTFSNDGFRKVDPAKDAAFDVELLGLLRKNVPRSMQHSVVSFDIEDRVRMMEEIACLEHVKQVETHPSDVNAHE